MKSILSKMIKDMRIEKGLSQGQLAVKSNLDRTTISKIESGERKKPLPYTLYEICEVLDLDFVEVLYAAGYSEEEINEIMDDYNEGNPECEAIYSFKFTISGLTFVDGESKEEIDTKIKYILSKHISNLLDESRKNELIKTNNEVAFSYKIESCDWND